MTEFARLVEHEIPRLRRYARALTRDASRADDLVQSALVRAVAKQHLWQPGTDLRAWLFTILHNQHVNDVRRGMREGTMIPVEDVASVLTVDSKRHGFVAITRSRSSAGASPRRAAASDPARRHGRHALRGSREDPRRPDRDGALALVARPRDAARPDGNGRENHRASSTPAVRRTPDTASSVS